MAEGVRKIDETRGIVDGLKEDLAKLQPVLKVKAEETAELLKVVAKEGTEAEKVEVVVNAEAKVVEKQADEVRLVQADAQADLDKAKGDNRRWRLRWPRRTPRWPRSRPGSRRSRPRRPAREGGA